MVLKPASVITFSAARMPIRRTFGTVTITGPSERVSVILSPFLPGARVRVLADHQALGDLVGVARSVLTTLKPAFCQRLPAVGRDLPV